MTRPGTVSSVLVVGGGLGGFHTALALRRAGFGGEITVLGAEPHLPYDRPPLSKAFLDGTLDVADLALDDADDPVDVHWVCAAPAAALIHDQDDGDQDDGRPPRPGVRTEDGRRLLADAVVVATGADAVRIGPPAPGAHVLRTLDDALALRDQGLAGRAVVVVGTGFVGLEAAAVAAALGAAAVTVVSPERAPLLDRLGPAVASAVQALHERRGVRFRCGTAVTELLLDEAGAAAGVATSDGPVAGDVVVVGVGVRPATGWLDTDGHGPALGPAGRVRCDHHGRTDRPGVWALGDCAQWTRHDQPGTARPGHWQDALDEAAVVAADIVGAARPEVPPPYFWSDQHGVRIQVVGHLTGDETSVVRAGSAEAADLLVVYERDGVEVAALGMNRPRDVARWRREHRVRPPTPTADPTPTRLDPLRSAVG